MKINIDIEEVILTLEEDIEKLDRNPPMNVIIVADLDIGLMNVICLKLSKLYKYIYLLIYFFFKFRKPYSGRKDDRSYSSNSYDHKPKKQEYSDKKEKANIPTPNIELKNSKSDAIKDQTEKTKEPEPPKPVEEKPNNE